MDFSEALYIAERNRAKGATVIDFRELVPDLRALASGSILANLIEIRIEVIEGHWDTK